MSKITFEIKEQIATLSSSKGWSKEINLISWNGYEPKYDIRDWDSTHTKMGKGITLSGLELKELYFTLKEMFKSESPSVSSQELIDELKELALKAPVFYQEVKNLVHFMEENSFSHEQQKQLLLNEFDENVPPPLMTEIETLSIVYSSVFDGFTNLMKQIDSSNLSSFFDVLLEKNQETTMPISEDILYCTGKDSNARGYYKQEGSFVVLQGSLCNLIESATAGVVSTKRKELLAEGVLVQKGNILEFVQDYMFSSPSAACGVVLARRGNGWTEWKNENGVTLDGLIRSN